MVVNVYQLDALSEYMQFYMHLVWALLNPINCGTFEPGAAHNRCERVMVHIIIIIIMILLIFSSEPWRAV